MKFLAENTERDEFRARYAVKLACMAISLWVPAVAFAVASAWAHPSIAVLMLAAYALVTFDIGIRPEDRDE